MSDATNKSYKHSDITGKIIGCAMEGHRYLGKGNKYHLSVPSPPVPQSPRPPHE